MNPIVPVWDAISVLRILNEAGEMLDFASENGALPGGNFEGDFRFTFEAMKDPMQGIDNPVQPFLFAFTEVCARVKDDKGEAEKTAALEFVEQGRA